ncbi:unnamed protein product [Moneuplotes crassus]|uniref:Uncharacterized protein n=1 Tax=Euplotes crassus TaxID=5936 RepID=A0AAD1XPJ5_EUPCR|nr:unnamed protein product [Moneuplotes crassus]
MDVFSNFRHKHTKFCKHGADSSCLLHCVKGFTSNFLKGYCLRSGLLLLFTILKKRDLRLILKALFSKTAFSFGLFASSITFIYRAVLCLLRGLRKKDDKYNSLIAGLLSSITVVMEQNSAIRKLICYYFFANAIDSFLSTLESNGIAPKPKDWGLYSYSAMITFFIMNYALNPDIIGKKVFNLFTKIAFFTSNEKIVLLEIFPKRDFLLNENSVTLFGN